MIRSARASQKWQVILAAVSIAVVVGAVDYFTGALVRVLAFYLIPLGMLAWFVGRWSAVIGSFLCGLVWILANITAFGSTELSVWNTLVTTLTFLSFSWVVGLLQEDRERLRQMATLDELTGILNRRALLMALGHEVSRARRTGMPLSVVFIDIDRFKKLNDTRGHEVGDRALRLVAKVISHRIRTTDIAARLGGDEFVVVLPGSNSDAARLVTDDLFERLNAAVRKKDFDVSFSVGLVTYAEPPVDGGEIIKMADSLMYEAKAGGKDRIASRYISRQEESPPSKQPTP